MILRRPTADDARIGFSDYVADPGFELTHGRVMGRIFRAFDV